MLRVGLVWLPHEWPPLVPESRAASSHCQFPLGIWRKFREGPGGLGLPWKLRDVSPASQPAGTLVLPVALVSCIICRWFYLKLPDSLGTEDSRPYIYLEASCFIWRAANLFSFLDC